MSASASAPGRGPREGPQEAQEEGKRLKSFAGGRYAVERTLGGGGMAAVYFALDEELGRAVAVKVLAEQLAGDDTFRERFLREARLAARLSHPNIVSVFDAGEDDGRPYIIMEYVEGSTLAAELRRRERFTPAEAVDVGLQTCAGLTCAHEAGLVHRDVKPGNLLRRIDGVVKIADFGIARAAETTQLTMIGTVLGTAAYLSPEQAAGEQVTAAADLYSLGVVLYELLTGRTPHTFDSLTDLAKQREAPIAPIRELAAEVPEALEDVVMRCLARNPAYRPASAAELARELEAASPEASTRPMTAETARMPSASGRRIADRRLWLALAAAVALIGVVLAFALPRHDSGPSTPAVKPVRPGSSPAERARNLAAWLRDHSG